MRAHAATPSTDGARPMARSWRPAPRSRGQPARRRAAAAEVDAQRDVMAEEVEQCLLSARLSGIRRWGQRTTLHRHHHDGDRFDERPLVVRHRQCDEPSIVLSGLDRAAGREAERVRRRNQRLHRRQVSHGHTATALCERQRRFRLRATLPQPLAPDGSKSDTDAPRPTTNHARSHRAGRPRVPRCRGSPSMLSLTPNRTVR
jgi:hypothetical protein